MTRCLAFCALAMTVCLFSGCARARIFPSAQGPEAPLSITPGLKEIPAGERLEYQVYWWGIPAGLATLTTQREKGTSIRLTCKARSSAYLDPLYPVRVEMTSIVEGQSVRPRRFQAYVKRRWRVHESTIAFDWNDGKAVHDLPKEKTITVPIRPTTQDGLSLLYYARTMPFQLGESVSLEVTADGKNWALTGEVDRAYVIRMGRLGEWPAVEGQVRLTYPIPFFHGAKARVWFSADGNRIPILAKIHSRIGPVTIVLTRYAQQDKPSS